MWWREGDDPAGSFIYISVSILEMFHIMNHMVLLGWVLPLYLLQFAQVPSSSQLLSHRYFCASSLHNPQHSHFGAQRGLLPPVPENLFGSTPQISLRLHLTSDSPSYLCSLCLLSVCRFPRWQISSQQTKLLIDHLLLNARPGSLHS